MENVIVEWKIAGWAENVLVVLIGIAMAGLAAWLVLNAIKDVLDRAARLEEARSKKTDKALAEWMETYRDEHAKRITAEQKAQQERSMRQQIAKGADNAKADLT